MEQLINAFIISRSNEALIASAKKVASHAEKHPMSVCTLDNGQQQELRKAIRIASDHAKAA